MSENVSKQVKSIIAKECGVKRKFINNNTLFMSGQSFSYFDCMSVLFSLQHKFHVQLPESDYYKYKTVGHLIKTIIKQQHAK